MSTHDIRRPRLRFRRHAQRHRGLIHLAGTAGAPEVEFINGEGPEQVLDRIQSHALPRIRQAQDGHGRHLRWQCFEADSGVVRRHRSPLDERLGFEVSDDERAIELLLDGNGLADGRAPRVPLSEDTEDAIATVGWTVESPRLSWRYRRNGRGAVLVLTWSCRSLPWAWAQRLRERQPELPCQVDVPTGGTVRLLPLPDDGQDGLVYRGDLLLDAPLGHSELPALLDVTLRPPLVLWNNGHDPREGGAFRARLACSADVHDAVALLGGPDGEPTRFVAEDEAGRPFRVRLTTDGETLLPGVLPAGLVAGLPWVLEVTAEDEPTDGALPPTERHWLLQPLAGHARAGTWTEVDWQAAQEDGTVAFGLGDGSAAPSIRRIDSRRAQLTWHSTDGSAADPLCLTEARWTPHSIALRERMPDGLPADGEPITNVAGVDEWLYLDAASEIPNPRLQLDPRRWRFYNHMGEVTDGEALGEVRGNVRWRHPAEQAAAVPTRWASGAAPVLLLRRDGDDWGGLYVPESVPWDALSEVHPATVETGVLLAPRPASSSIWLDLHGFVVRHDLHRLSFEDAAVHGWLSRVPLPLFPRERRHLLRSFAAVHAVRSPSRHLLQLTASPGTSRRARPTLHLGQELVLSEDFRIVDVGPDTRLRYQQADMSAGPPGTFGPVRTPGSRLRLPGVRPSSLWIALAVTETSDAGLLLNWDAEAGWQQRGFFHAEGQAAALGTLDDGRRVLLGDGPASDDKEAVEWHGEAANASASSVPLGLRAWEPQPGVNLEPEVEVRKLTADTGSLPVVPAEPATDDVPAEASPKVLRADDWDDF